MGVFYKLETCFPFLNHCWPIRARDVSHFKITKKEKCDFSDFTRDFSIIFSQNVYTRWLSSMDEKNKRKNMFLTDTIARKAFFVGGLFYPIRKLWSWILSRSYKSLVFNHNKYKYEFLPFSNLEKINTCFWKNFGLPKKCVQFSFFNFSVHYFSNIKNNNNVCSRFLYFSKIL
mgnify:CR=1 FL=1